MSSKMGKELWVCGFNAFNQLQFDEIPPSGPQPDLTKFTLVLKDERIELLKTSITASIVDTSDEYRVAGSPGDFLSHWLECDVSLEVVMAGNGKIAAIGQGTIRQWDSFEDYDGQGDGLSIEFNTLENQMEDNSDGGPRKDSDSEYSVHIEKARASETGFTALSPRGLFTWGDPRYEACLGREVMEDQPADEPHLVECFEPFTRIFSGGYVTAALTKEGDVYFWGRPLPGLEELITTSPTPLDLYGYDFHDVAVGFNHIMVLTADRKLFVVGDGGNGQLGMDVKQLRDWQEVKLPLKDGQVIEEIFAGYKNSFVIVKDNA